MTPPPLNSESGELNKSFSRNAATGSLLAPIIVILLGTALQNLSLPKMLSLLIGLSCFAILMAGMIFGILALCGIKKHGTSGILWKGITGLTLGGFCMILFVLGFVHGVKQAQKSRQFTADISETADQLRESVRQSYDSKNGLTNINIAGLDKLRTQLDEASKTLSGEDARVSKAIAEFVTELQDIAVTFQSTVGELREKHVLQLSDLKTREEVERRRTMVNKFIAANTALSGFISNAETTIQTKLQAANVSARTIDQTLKGYRSQATRRNAIMLQIRECDDRVGHRMLDILNLLEKDWGNWSYDAETNQVQFDNPESRQKYSKWAEEMDSASSEEVFLQGRLVNSR